MLSAVPTQGWRARLLYDCALCGQGVPWGPWCKLRALLRGAAGACAAAYCAACLELAYCARRLGECCCSRVAALMVRHVRRGG